MLVATYNVHRFRGHAGLPRPQRTLGVVAEIAPDVIALQEAMGMFGTLRQPFPDAALRAIGLKALPLPHGAGQSWCSNMILLRDDARILRQPALLRLGGLEPRGAISVVLDLGEGPFHLLATHLSLGAQHRRSQATSLLEAFRQHPDMSTLIMGDLNEWRHRGSVLSVLAEDFGCSARVASYPSFMPRLALDHVVSGPGGVVTDVHVHDTPAARWASDHLPVVARFDLCEASVMTLPKFSIAA